MFKKLNLPQLQEPDENDDKTEAAAQLFRIVNGPSSTGPKPKTDSKPKPGPKKPENF